MKGMQKISRGRGFRGALNYAFDRDSADAEPGRLLGGNMSGQNARQLAAEFGQVRKLRPDIERPVWHNALRLIRGEALTDAQWVAIADDYMNRMGFSEFHPRAYVLHDDADGQHIHIVASRVSTEGKVYVGKNENLASTRHIQALERDHGLTITKGPTYDPDTNKVVMPEARRLKAGEVEQAMRTGVEPPRQKLQRLIDAAKADRPTAAEFARRLTVAGVGVRANVASTGRLNGFSFELDSVKFKASQLGDKYKWNELQKEISYDQTRDRAGLEGQQRPGRPGKPHSKQQHRAGVGRTAAAPKRAFTAWRDDRESDSPGLRTSKHLGPQPLQKLRDPRPGQGQQEHRHSLLLGPVQGHRRWGGDHRLYSLSTRRGKHMTTPITLPPSAATAGLDCGEHTERRQEYKKMLLSSHYADDISKALVDQLLYVDRRKDNTLLITLRDEAGSIAGQVHDKGDTLMALSPEINDTEILAMLEIARAKRWASVTPTGSPEFCKRAAELAAAAGFGVDKAVPQNALTQSAPASSADSGATTVTPDASAGAVEPERQPTVAEIRWADALLSARTRLADELKAAQTRLAEIPQVDIAKLEADRAAKHGGEEYKTVLSDYKAAVAAAKDANVFTRSRAEDRKEAMRRRLVVAREKALAVPAAAASIKMAKEHNQERAQIEERLVPIKVGLGELDFHLAELRRGVDPEAKFAEAWRLRKARDLKLWEQYALAPVFTADAQREQARQQAETEAKEASAAQTRQEQAQREISWQQKADDLLPLLNQPGRSAEQEEALQQEHRYYTALAQGYDEAEARERAECAHPTDVARP